jgi:hypothetical protein
MPVRSTSFTVGRRPVLAQKALDHSLGLSLHSQGGVRLATCYMDHTGCHHLQNNVVKSANPATP